MKQLGYEAMNFANFFGLVAPAAVPAGVLQRLTQEVAAVAQAPDTRAALRKLGVDSYPAMTASDFQRFLEEERQRWGTVIRGLGLKPE